MKITPILSAVLILLTASPAFGTKAEEIIKTLSENGIQGYQMYFSSEEAQEQ